LMAVEAKATPSYLETVFQINVPRGQSPRLGG